MRNQSAPTRIAALVTGLQASAARIKSHEDMARLTDLSAGVAR